MARVRLWISAVPGVAHAFLIEHDDGGQDCYPLRHPPEPGGRMGTSYPGEFKGHAGTFCDLPFGFPTSNPQAAQRLNDPSIPQRMKQLIRENFPLQAQPSRLVYS